MLSRYAVSTLCRNSQNVLRPQPSRIFHQKSTRLERIAAKHNGLQATVLTPGGRTAVQMGKSLVAGAAVLGLGALGYYGLGMSNQMGTIDRSMVWPEYVRERVRSTYAYFGGSLLITAASAVAIARSPAAMSIIACNTWPVLLGSIALMIGSQVVVRSIPYEPGFGRKQLAWIGHSALLGAMTAPLCFLGGPLILRAACYTAGIVGGLSSVAVCAPSDQFLYMAGPLSVGLGVVFASSMASMFLPVTTALGAGIYSISMYGGLVLFSGFILYDTQRIVHKAENHPQYAMQPFDPVNASISIYVNTLNIFWRMAMLLRGNSGKR